MLFPELKCRMASGCVCGLLKSVRVAPGISAVSTVLAGDGVNLSL